MLKKHLLFFTFVIYFIQLHAQSNIGISSLYIQEKNNLKIGFLNGEINQTIKKWNKLKLTGGIELAGAIYGNRGGFFAFGYRSDLAFKISKRLELTPYVSLLAGGGASAPDKDGWLINTGGYINYSTNTIFDMKFGFNYGIVSGNIIKGFSPYIGLSSDLSFKNTDSLQTNKKITWKSNSMEFGIAKSPNGTINLIGIAADWEYNKWISGELSIHAIANKYGGYMQTLLSSGLQFGTNNLNFYAGGVLGMGGGGAAVVNGGGLYGYQISSSIDLNKIILGVKYRNIKPFEGTFKYDGLFLTLGKEINPNETGKMKWCAQIKNYLGADRFSNIGARFTLLDNNFIALSGSTYWAFTDNMGAYAEGLFDIKISNEKVLPLYVIGSTGAGAGAGINKATKSLISSLGLGINSPWKSLPISLEGNFWVGGNIPKYSLSLNYNFN